jgi:hypothetical protein
LETAQRRVAAPDSFARAVEAQFFRTEHAGNQGGKEFTFVPKTAAGSGPAQGKLRIAVTEAIGNAQLRDFLSNEPPIQ